MKKITVALTIALVALLLLATMALAYYSSVTGELRDYKTAGLWQYGGTVAIINCSDGTVITSQVLADGVSSFNIALSDPVGFQLMCVQVTFRLPDDSNGQTVVEIYPNIGSGIGGSDEGSLDAGVFWSDTGPNAVTLTNITARSANTWLPVGLVAGLSVLAMGALFTLRKR